MLYLRVSFMLAFGSSIPYALAAQHLPKAVIVDTDIFSDVDDVGALAVANVLYNCGFADLKAVMINTGSRYGALAASAINTYFGNGDIPIGAIKPLTEETFLDRYYYRLGEYASKVAHNFPRSLNESDDTQDPVQLYRSKLAESANASLTLISIGFLINLADLLQSDADDISSMTGSELIEAKVAELVVMGGRYPSGWEFNFAGVDPKGAAFVLDNWPRAVPMTFSGYELGAQIYSGGELPSQASTDSPVLAAYQWYGDRCNTTGRSYDPVTVLYGILGLDGYEAFGLQSPFVYANDCGYNTLDAKTGIDSWVTDERITNQHWLRLRESVLPEDIGRLLDRLLTCSPSSDAVPQDSCCSTLGLEMQIPGETRLHI